MDPDFVVIEHTIKKNGKVFNERREAKVSRDGQKTPRIDVQFTRKIGNKTLVYIFTKVGTNEQRIQEESILHKKKLTAFKEEWEVNWKPDLPRKPDRLPLMETICNLEPRMPELTTNKGKEAQKQEDSEIEDSQDDQPNEERPEKSSEEEKPETSREPEEQPKHKHWDEEEGNPDFVVSEHFIKKKGKLFYEKREAKVSRLDKNIRIDARFTRKIGEQVVIITASKAGTHEECYQEQTDLSKNELEAFKNEWYKSWKPVLPKDDGLTPLMVTIQTLEPEIPELDEIVPELDKPLGQKSSEETHD